MPKFTVRIETSVSITAKTPKAAAKIAADWAAESLSDCNALVRVYEDTLPSKLGRKVLDVDIEAVQ